MPISSHICALWILLSFAACSPKGLHSITKVIEVNESTEYYNYKYGRLSKVNRIIKVAYRNDYRMFIFSVSRYSTKDEYNRESNTLTSNVVKTDTLYRYYVINNQSIKGIAYGINGSPDGKLFLLEDMLKQNGLDSNNQKILSLDLGKPTKVIRESKSKWTEIYSIANNDKYDFDSVYRLFDNNFSDVNFSFSPSLDRQNKTRSSTTKKLNR